MTAVRTQLAHAAVRARRPLAPDALRVVVAQQARLPASAARDAHVRALADGAAAVVTGQQVGLFLGPLYTLYKAASAVVLARTLAAETGVPVVPVFWLQTEDHDIVEIASCGLVGERVTVAVDPANRRSIAHLVLPADVRACVERVAAIVGDGPHARAHVERLARHYRPGARWADAFAGLLAELLDELVILDPRDRALAAHVAPIYRRAILEADTLVPLTGPVHVRAGSPLVFFHPDGAEGPRVRLDPVGADRYVEVGAERVHARRELLAALEHDPLCCSTSALLRPLVQDTLLPTVAYVGGPAEVAYAAQLAPLYQALGLAQPAVVRRASFTIVDVRMRALLARLGLAPGDATASEDELLARVRRDAVTAEAIVARLFAPFAAAHAELAGELAGLDRALARTRASVERAIGKLARKAERAALHADAELVAAVRRVRATLGPEGAPQERVLSLSAFATRDGDRALVERVLAATDPFDPSLKELS